MIKFIPLLRNEVLMVVVYSKVEVLIPQVDPLLGGLDLQRRWGEEQSSQMSHLNLFYPLNELGGGTYSLETK